MKKLLIILVLGLLIKLVVMPQTMHPDFKAYNFAAYLIAQKGKLLTFYDHISGLPRNDIIVAIYGDGQFNYPPLAYLSHAVFNKLLGPIYPWDAFEKLIYDYDNFRGSPNSAWLVFLLKVPYLLADLACVWLIRKLFTDNKSKNLATIVWWLNPLVIYSAYMMGQFDIFIALSIIAALLFSSRRQLPLAAIALGVAAGFKVFPLVLLPFLPGSKIKNVFIGVATYALIVAPFISSTAFKHYALMASQTDKPFVARVMVSGSQYLPLFVIGLVLLLWWNFLREKDLSEYGWLSAPLFLFFGITHFHPQWLVWLAPFLVIAWVKSPKTRWLQLVYLASYVVVILGFDPSLHFGLFGWAIDPLKKISVLYSIDQFVSMFRGVLAATGAVMLLQLKESHK